MLEILRRYQEEVEENCESQQRKLRKDKQHCLQELSSSREAEVMAYEPASNAQREWKHGRSLMLKVLHMEAMIKLC